jgi:DNA-binding Lrp family transcriptional regulator
MMDIKIDKVDRKILLELSKNARTGPQNIAKRLSISRQLVDYRIRSMKKRKIILNQRLSINYSLLGLSTCVICLSMRNFDSEKEVKFRDFLIKNKEVAWAASVSGRWDFIIYVYYRQLSDLDQTIDCISGFQKGNIEDKEILPIIKKHRHNILIGDLKKDLKKTSSKYERDLSSFERLIKKQKKENSVKLDNIDLRILEMLNKDCTTQISKISKALKLNKDTVAYRIKKMISSKVIHNFILSINYPALGYEEYFILLELENFSEAGEKNMLPIIDNDNSVLFVAKTFGRKNLLVELYCKSAKDFKDSLYKIKETLSPHLKSFSSIQVLEEIKPYAIRLD